MKKVLVFLVLFSFFSCEKNDENINLDPKIKFKVNFDSNLPRLGNLGQIVNVPPQNGSQNPNVDEVLIHYIELAKDSLTPLLTGEILYTGITPLSVEIQQLILIHHQFQKTMKYF